MHMFPSWESGLAPGERDREETPIHTSNVSDLVHQYFSAYESKDRKALEDLLSDDFTFSSPHDDHITKTNYFERCWPYSAEIHAFHIEKLFAKGNEAFVRYECKPRVGPRFRNTEFFRIEGNRIKEEVDVYFGRNTEGGNGG